MNDVVGSIAADKFSEGNKSSNTGNRSQNYQRSRHRSRSFVRFVLVFGRCTPENVIIEVDNTTISPESISIIITDNNEEHYGWGVEFRVQQKIDNEWEDLEYVSDDLSWIDIAYEVNEDNQLTLKLDIEKYYGKLSNGIYRIVKPVYDNGYIDIYLPDFKYFRQTDRNGVTYDSIKS